MRNVKWADVPSYEGIYQISDNGQLRSVTRENSYTTLSGRLHKRIVKGKALKLYKDSDGYMRVDLCVNGIKKHFLVHRLVYMAFVDRELRNQFIDHIDGDSRNNQVSNLRACSNIQNASFVNKKRKNKTGYVGVYFAYNTKRSGPKYGATIVDPLKSTRQIRLGVFNSPEEAHNAYCAARIKFYGDDYTTQEKRTATRNKHIKTNLVSN